MTIPYTYLIRNKVTNQFYYGSRYKNVSLSREPEDDLWIKYFTSSKIINNMILEYGVNSFDVFIIRKNIDYDVCYWTEQELIKDNISNPLCVNQYYIEQTSGKKKFSAHNRIISDETRQKHSQRIISDETRKKMSSSRMNKTISEETRKKQSVIRTGRKLKTNVESLKRKSSRTYEEISGYELGLKRRKMASENTRKYHEEHPKVGSLNANSKCFKITDPTGNISIITGQMGTFCKNNKLNRGIMIDVAKGRRDHYRGWRIEYVVS